MILITVTGVYAKRGLRIFDSTSKSRRVTVTQRAKIEPPFSVRPSRDLKPHFSVKPTFTASLLAGGKSRRMGQDKALLHVMWQGAPTLLWKRQLSILGSLNPDEVVISGRRKSGYPDSLTVIPDDWEDKGPLGGIATCLSKTHTDLLLILAVDLPFVQPLFLRTLLDRARVGCGVIPVHRDRFEPLVAVYPLLALEPALDSLKRGDLVLQHFADRLLTEKLLVTYRVEPWEQFQLQNWNTPEDVSEIHSASPSSSFSG
jgi:molybdenum cofactor guanylyltransferase